MKIRISLRLYFLSAMLMLGIAMVTGFSVLMMNYFVEGMDTVLQINMSNAAENTEAQDGKPVTILSYHVATRWQDVPEVIRQNIPNPPEKPFGFIKMIDEANWFEPPDAGYFVLRVNDKHDQTYYVSHLFEKGEECNVEHEELHPFLWIGIVGITSLFLFFVLLVLMIRSMANPVEQLGAWAKSLNVDKLHHSPPDFRYNELNKLAQIIQNSLNSVHKTLQREHDFLRHASHELRTPITVLRGNIDLLKKINSTTTSKEIAIIDRIERAGLTMGDLTETLLWLSREHETPPLSETIALNELLKELVKELKYLLQGKNVEIIFNSSPYQIKAPRAACRMVLSNLIRNAFEHTQAGTIFIEQLNAQILIHNRNSNIQAKGEELGFGLGLKLTEKLTHRFGWSYQSQATEYGHNVEVSFDSKKH